MKRIHALLLVFVMLFAFTACGNNVKTPSTQKNKVETIEYESAAISAVKSYKEFGVLKAEQVIARALGFKQFSSPQYGVCSATKDEYTDSWEVTLKGEMGGYTDEYHSKHEYFKFYLTARVSHEGIVSSFSASKVS